MKFNISFDWAVITSIFTLFLYWCGFWYYSGFLSFYNYDINAFDLPLAPLIIAGFLVGAKSVISLLILLTLLSFLISVNKQHWDYLFTKAVVILTNIYLLFYYLVQQLRKVSSKQSPGFFSKNLGFFFNWLKPKLRSTIRLDTLIGRKVERFLKHRKLTDADIKKKIYGTTNTPLSHSFEFSMLVHNILIIVLLVGLVYLMKIGQNQSEKGKAEAEKQFNNYSKMTQVIIKDNLSTDLRSIEVCFKGTCLITDHDKNIQAFDMKDIKFLNDKVEEKAP